MVDSQQLAEGLKAIEAWDRDQLIAEIQRLRAEQLDTSDTDERLGDFARLSADWFFELDAELRYVYLSQTNSDRGLAPKQFVGKSRRELLGPLYDPENLDEELRAMELRAPYKNIVRRSDLAPDQWLRVSGEPLFSKDGTFLGYRGASVDISELKQQEAALAQGAAQLRLITNALPVIIAYVDADWRYRFANRQFAEFADRPAEDFIGATVREVMGARHFEILEERMGQALRGEMVAFQSTFEDRQGATRHFSTDYRPHFDDDGVVLGFYVLAIDVTERADIESQLRQAQKMEIVGQLTAGLAHDFNNMLAIIDGNLSLLEMDLPADDPAMEFIEASLRAVRQGGDLAHRMLSFSRRQNPKVLSIDANKVIDGALEFIQVTLTGDVAVEISPARDLWPCNADPAQLEQTLLNLAINAGDALRDGRKGGGFFHITSRNVTLPHDKDHDENDRPNLPPGDYVAISVSDNGSGMGAETAARIFDPFFTTKSEMDGTGLGLSMVYGFVKQFDGDITVSSRLGHGTTFHLYFPTLARADEPADDSKQAAQENASVLLVEDDADVRLMTERILRRKGYDVACVSTAEEALERLGSGGNCDLLLTDIVLPGGMDGAQLANQARLLRPGLKMLFMSGYTRDAFAAHGQLLAEARMIKKPFQSEDLITGVREALAPASMNC